MSEHNVTDAATRLSDLIDRALAGEGVVITREGRPIAELTPIRGARHPTGGIDLEWLRQRRVFGRLASTDAGILMSDLRDEGER